MFYLEPTWVSARAGLLDADSDPEELSWGANLTITHNLRFLPAFSGLMQPYMQAVGLDKIVKVWKRMATWTP